MLCSIFLFSPFFFIFVSQLDNIIWPIIKYNDSFLSCAQYVDKPVKELLWYNIFYFYISTVLCQILHLLKQIVHLFFISFNTSVSYFKVTFWSFQHLDHQSVLFISLSFDNDLCIFLFVYACIFFICIDNHIWKNNRGWGEYHLYPKMGLPVL